MEESIPDEGINSMGDCYLNWRRGNGVEGDYGSISFLGS